MEYTGKALLRCKERDVRLAAFPVLPYVNPETENLSIFTKSLPENECDSRLL